jgi:hypothetical protein
MKLKPMPLQGKTAVIEKYLELGDKSNKAFIAGMMDDPSLLEFTDYCLEHHDEIQNYFEINRAAMKHNIAYNMQRLEEAGLI